MSSLINNLNEIYEIKKQIKEVAYIESDVFSEYPSYIQTAIQSGGATGTITITSNGTHSISTYASAYVNVPMQEVPVVPDGYTYVYGGKDIITNGYNIDTASYSYVNVQVPIPDGFIYPSGYAYVTTNGDFDIRNFEAININVPTGVTPTGTYNIITNGTWSVASYAYAYVDVPIDWSEVEADGYTYVRDEAYMFNNHIRLTSDGDLLGVVRAPGYAAVELHLGLENLVNPNAYSITTNGTFDVLTYGTAYVNVQGGAAVLGYTTITTNGTTYASSYDLDGFSYVNVAVPQSGSSYTLIDDTSDISASDQLVTATVVSTADNYATYITPELAQQYPIYEHFVGTYLSDKAKLNGTDILFAAAQYFGKGTYMCNATTYIMDSGGFNIYCLTAGDNLLVGGVPASGTYNINTNGTFDISSYQYCSVSVPESIVLPYVMFAREQYTDLPIFVNPNDSTEKYYVVSANANYGDYYYVELKPLYNTASNPMVYTVEELNLVELGTTTTATWYFYNYDVSWIQYKYGNNGIVASHYVSLHDGVNIYNPVTFLLNNNYSEFTTMTADTPVEISYITFGGWNLIYDYSIPNS